LSIFKKHKTIADRSASDRKRHKVKIDKAIKEGLKHIVAEESIIGKDGSKKIRIPVKGIKEYRLVYGTNENNKKVGSAKGKDVKRGQKIVKKGQKAQQGKDKAGNQKGEEIYSVEVTLDELSSYLFENLKLPKMLDKKFKQIVDRKFKRSGYRPSGIRPRLSKKQTAIQRIRRKKSKERKEKEKESLTTEEVRFPFNEKDLRYKHIKVTEKVAVVFISHTTEAKEVDEEKFFKRTSSGGTMLSSAPLLAKEIIYKRYHPNFWNIYMFHGSDGDNWENDIEKCIYVTEELKKICQLYCFCEIDPANFDDRDWSFPNSSKMSKEYQYIVDDVFKTIFLTRSEDVWPAFEGIFGVDQSHLF
jgi:uncharacterized sporulation protein YeaH/YhbH (DUF444 family)